MAMKQATKELPELKKFILQNLDVKNRFGDKK